MSVITDSVTRGANRDRLDLKEKIERNGFLMILKTRYRLKLTNVGTTSILGMAALLLAGCVVPNSSPPAPSNRPATSVNAIEVHEKMVIETGKMDGKPGWPRFVPPDLTFRAGSKVVLTITSYDDGTAPLPASSPFGNVWGSDPTFGIVSGGTETVDGKVVTKIPNDKVAHTFTIPGLLINVPIPAVQSGRKSTTVVYTFKVDKSGTFTWQCEAPCGSGSTGMGGAMNENGWMRGVVRVTGPKPA